MLADETWTLGNHIVDQDRMFMNIAHEKLIAVLFRKNISQIETSPAMSRLVYMVADGLDIIVYEKVYILFALFVVDTPLYDMEKMRNHTTCGKALSHVVEIKTPGIG